MTNKPQDPSSGDRKASDNAPAQQRQAEAERAEAAGGHDAESASLHARVKQHAPDDLDPVQNSSDEPVIEDEP